MISPRVPEEGPLLALQNTVEALVVGHSLEPSLRRDVIQAIRRIRPQCVVVFVYRDSDYPNEPLADVAVDVTKGSGALVEELRFRLGHIKRLPFLSQLLSRAIEVTGADFGNIQLIDPATHDLRIATQRGFSEEFLRFFAVVHGNDTACGSALYSGSRVIVENVATAPIFRGRPSGEMMLRANSYAVQSTPLIATSGELLGMVSTHFRKPTRIAESSLVALDQLTEGYAARLEIERSS